MLVFSPSVLYSNNCRGTAYAHTVFVQRLSQADREEKHPCIHMHTQAACSLSQHPLCWRDICKARRLHEPAQTASVPDALESGCRSHSQARGVITCLSSGLHSCMVYSCGIYVCITGSSGRDNFQLRHIYIYIERERERERERINFIFLRG